MVAGTGVPRAFSAELASLSQYLGVSLANKGYGLVTGGWPGVDETVARAFADGTEELGVALEDRLVQVVAKKNAPAFAAGQLVFVDNGDAEWTESIRRSTAVLLLGGLGGTWTTGEMALRMGKPVLPLADTGGDAKKFYLHMLKTWDQLAWEGLDQHDFLRVARPGEKGVDAALEMLATCGAAVSDSS